jgi:serine/threonine-protein kinase
MSGGHRADESGTFGVDPALADPDLDLPPARLADFEIKRRLSQHEGVTSYLAIRRGILGFAKLVLLRVADYPFHERPEIGLRITDEARVGMRLSHPNLLQTLDLGRDLDRFFLVRQWISGVGLRALLKDNWSTGESLSLPVALRITVGVCRALDYLHGLRSAPWASRGLVHRAIKPSNILLSTSGEIRVANVSVPRPPERSESVSQGELRIGAYVAPEVAEGLAADRRADLFSLGAVMYESLVGPDAFRGDPASDWNRFRTWAGGPPDHPRLATVPEPIRELLRRTLVSDRDKRIDSAAALRVAAQKILREEYRSDGDGELRLAVSRYRAKQRTEDGKEG